MSACGIDHSDRRIHAGPSFMMFLIALVPGYLIPQITALGLAPQKKSIVIPLTRIGIKVNINQRVVRATVHRQTVQV